MSLALVKTLSEFTNPGGEIQLQALDDAVQAINLEFFVMLNSMHCSIFLSVFQKQTVLVFSGESYMHSKHASAMSRHY